MLEVSEAGWSVLRGERQVRLREELKQARGGSSPGRSRGGSSSGGRSGGSSAAADELDTGAASLFEALRGWRISEAKAQKLPAYVVFNDATLRGIASLSPSTLDELATVSGVGAAKLERYGEAVLTLVAEHQQSTK